MESKNKDLGTYSCKLDRHTIAHSLSLKGLEGKSVWRNLLEVAARILDELSFRYKYTELTIHYQTNTPQHIRRNCVHTQCY